MRAEPDRCSSRSLAREEPLFGTASTVRSWLLLEQPGPWGAHALTESRLPQGLGARLLALSRRTGIRVILIRRHGPSARPARPTCFVAHTGPADVWLRRADLSDIGDVLDLDLSRVAQGEPRGLQPHDGPVFLVCTHGRRDPCCAERGRPLARALDERFPGETWECSHIGGDRFAGNLVCFPHGLYFGRVGPDEATEVAGGYARGSIALHRYRGRSCYGFPVQAAEYFLRIQMDLTGIDDVRPVGQRATGDEIQARFAVGNEGAFAVRVGQTVGEPHRLTCHSTAALRPPTFELLEIRPVASSADWG